MFKKLGMMLAAVMLIGTTQVNAAPAVGEAAPEIEATDIHGNAFKLSDHKGKIVVLEWTNHECPFVIKHYDTQNVQNLQNQLREKGVEWVSIVSSADGKQGHVSPEEAKAIIAKAGANPTTKILDASGAIGKSYDAKTTPHMFVIDADGNVAYKGAIDDNSSPRHSTVEGAKNYVVAAVDNLIAGQPVETAQTSPYGCSVKY